MKTFVKSVMSRTPFKITRQGRANRFAAIEGALKSLSKRGFEPDHVFDAGANVGSFASFALQLFPKAMVHSIEPQPGCQESLEALRSKSGGRLAIYQAALGAPEQNGSIVNLAADAASTSTGAHIVSTAGAGKTIEVRCITLDRLLQGALAACEGALLKLDLQGYELEALRGGALTLGRCEVVLTEFSFYSQDYEPPILDLVSFMAEAGFKLYDVASIYARPRDDRPRQGDFIFVRGSSPLMVDNSWN
ncbi:FkbM family methyltransferase [Aurantiacibacter hainanensis]|uniref:FkbM family methyltransferase n=1 Tax=Aurantiacibacter hainanensis TaxID=3076114 RepID=UPI0030C6EEFF